MALRRLTTEEKSVNAPNAKRRRVNKQKGNVVGLPMHLESYSGRQGVQVIAMTPAPATTVLNNAGSFRMHLDNKFNGVVRHPVFVFNVTLSAAARVAPTFSWFESIRCERRNGAMNLASWFPGDMEIRAHAWDKNDHFARLMNYDPLTGGPVKNTQAVLTRDYYLPLPYSVFENWLLHLQGDSRPDEVDVVFFPKGNITNDGGAVTTTLNSLKLISATGNYPQARARADQKLLTTGVAYHNYLDVQVDSLTGQTLTAGTAFKFNLKNFGPHDSAFLACFIRRNNFSYTSGADTAWEYMDIGEGGSVDLVTASGISLMGKGTGIPQGYMQSHFQAQLFGNSGYSKNSNVLILPFAHNLEDALHGVVNGYKHIGSQQEYLQITPGAAGTLATQTITQAVAVMDGATYQLCWRGDVTDPLANNATAATIGTAFNKLPSVRKAGLECTFEYTTGTDFSATAGAVLTVTFQKVGRGIFDPKGELVTLIPLVDPGDVDVTTYAYAAGATPVYGSDISGTFDIHVHSFYYKRLRTVGGMIKQPVSSMGGVFPGGIRC